MFLLVKDTPQLQAGKGPVVDLDKGYASGKVLGVSAITSGSNVCLVCIAHISLRASCAVILDTIDIQVEGSC